MDVIVYVSIKHAILSSVSQYKLVMRNTKQFTYNGAIYLCVKHDKKHAILYQYTDTDMIWCVCVYTFIEHNLFY